MKILATTLFVLASSAFGQATRQEVGEALAAAQAAEAIVHEELAELQEAYELSRRQRVRVGEAREAYDAAQELFLQLMEEYLESFNQPDLRPGENLDWSVRAHPLESDLDWIAQGGAIASLRGLPTVAGFGDAYRLSREAGDEDIIFGVRGDNGRAWVGGLYGQAGTMELAYPGDESASAVFVGLDDTASIELVFGTHLTSAMSTGRVSCFNIGLRGPSDSFIIRANGGCEHFQADGCWFLAPRGHNYENEAYASGIHMDNWGTLVLRNWQWRGETPGSPGVKISQHLFYLKSGRISTLIENCDLFGANRSGFQRRPGVGYQTLPTDRMMIRGNYCDGHGTNFNYQEGGAVLTVWLSNPDTYIYDNVVTNFRYQALVISGQGTATNFPFLSSGNQHRSVFLAGNRFTPGPATERATASLASIDELHLWGDNEFVGDIQLDAIWNYNQNGTLNGSEYIYASEVPIWRLTRYNPSTGTTDVLTTEQKEALLVN